MYNTILWTIGTILYSRSLKLFFLHNWNLIPFKPTTLPTVSFWNCSCCPLVLILLRSRYQIRVEWRKARGRKPLQLSEVEIRSKVITQLVISASGLRDLSEFTSPFRVSPTLLGNAIAQQPSSWLNVSNWKLRSMVWQKWIDTYVPTTFFIPFYFIFLEYLQSICISMYTHSIRYLFFWLYIVSLLLKWRGDHVYSLLYCQCLELCPT